MREAFFARTEGARFYMVEDGSDLPDDAALVKHHGNLDHLLTCLRCGTTEDISFKCVHIERVKKSRMLDYDD